MTLDEVMKKLGYEAYNPSEKETVLYEKLSNTVLESDEADTDLGMRTVAILLGRMAVLRAFKQAADDEGVDVGLSLTNAYRFCGQHFRAAFDAEVASALGELRNMMNEDDRKEGE